MPPEIHQMPGPDEWPINNDVKPIQPPLLKKSHCSMPKKVRIRALDKDQPHETINVTQHEYDVRRGNCGEKGHNAMYRSCRQLENPNRKK